MQRTAKFHSDQYIFGDESGCEEGSGQRLTGWSPLRCDSSSSFPITMLESLYVYTKKSQHLGCENTHGISSIKFGGQRGIKNKIISSATSSIPHVTKPAISAAYLSCQDSFVLYRLQRSTAKESIWPWGLWAGSNMEYVPSCST